MSPTHVALARPPADPIAVLRASAIFAGLSGPALEEAAAELEWRHLLSGDVLFRQGDVGDALYLVVSGRLRAIAEGRDGQERPLREIARGGNVGELALLTDEPRSATVRAVRDTVLARFPRRLFHELLSRHPGAVLPLTRALAALVRRAHLPETTAAAAATIALVPLQRTVDLAAMAEQLRRVLAAHGRAARIDAAMAEAHVPGGAAHGEASHPGHDALSAWLDELEAAHRYLVYQGDVGSVAWTRRCMREADRVLFVAAADADRREAADTLARLLRGAAPGAPRAELVLLHAPGTTPADTAGWLALHPFAAHHHCRLGEPRGIERLGRCLTGTSVGLVLSGGAAKGFAHIGVLRAFEEARVPIDHIGGTSMGSVIAAQYAAGLDPAQMLELNRLWDTHNPLRDVTVPVIALISGTSGRLLLENMFGDRRIEDLWLDYFCVSANLTRSQIAVHRHGPLTQWVRSSIAIPGIVPPLRLDNGDLLVDGAVLNNMPADVMRSRGAGRTIAVDVTPPEALPTDDYTDQPSTWGALRLLGSAILPFGTHPRSPTIFSILYRTMLMASRSLSERLKGEVDLYIVPPVSEFGFFDWQALDRIADAGFRAARDSLRQWAGTPPAVPPGRRLRAARSPRPRRVRPATRGAARQRQGSAG